VSASRTRLRQSPAHASTGADTPSPAYAQASAAFAEALAAMAAPGAARGAGPAAAAAVGPPPPAGPAAAGLPAAPKAEVCAASPPPRIADALAAAPRLPQSPGLSLMQALAALAPSAQPALATPPQRPPPPPLRAQGSSPAPRPDAPLAPPAPGAAGGGLFSDALLEGVVQRHLAQRGVPPLYLPGLLGTGGAPPPPGASPPPPPVAPAPPRPAAAGGSLPAHLSGLLAWPARAAPGRGCTAGAPDACGPGTRLGLVAGGAAPLAARSASAPHWLDALAAGAPLPAWRA